MKTNFKSLNLSCESNAFQVKKAGNKTAKVYRS